MEFMITAYDGVDAEAPARRQAARAEHLRFFEEFYRLGIFRYGAAILDEAGNMIGSLVVCDFPSRRDMEEQWLQHEPYMTGGVWKRLEIQPVRTPPFIPRV